MEQNKIFKYSQVYDYLKNIKFIDYVSNKRDILHKALFDNAINKLIEEVNNPDTQITLAKLIRANISLYDFYQSEGVSTDEFISALNDPKTTYKYRLAPFTKDNFKFIEYKNKVWYYPSKINIVYIKSLVKNENKNYIRLVFGPYLLSDLWNNKYILNKDFNKILKQENTSFVIEYIDYVSGNVILYDKLNMENITVPLDYILDVNNYEFSHSYDEMFTVKRNTIS